MTTVLCNVVFNDTTKWDGSSREIPYIGLEHIGQDSGNLEGVGNAAEVVSAKNVFKVGDVLFGKLRPNLKKYWQTEFEGICSTDILVLRPLEGILNEYLYYLVQSNPFLSLAMSDAVGTKMPRTSWKRLGGFEFLLPPFFEQERIAEILSSVDSSIRATEAVIAQAERVKRGLMEDLLAGGWGNEAIVLGKVPEGWNSRELKEICSIRGEYGANAPKSNYDPRLPRYVRITDIDDRGNLQEATTVSIPREKAASYILDEGDIVIARSGATVGKSYIHTADNGECAFAGYLVRFRLKPEIASYDWLKFVLQSKPYWDWVRDNQRAGAQPNINAKEYGNYPLKVPPLAEQQRIVRILGSIDELMSQNRKTVTQFRRLKQGLLDDLLSGRVRTV